MRIFPELIVTFFRFKLVFDLAGAVDGLLRICDRSEVVDGREGFSSSTYFGFYFDSGTEHESCCMILFREEKCYRKPS